MLSVQCSAVQCSAVTVQIVSSAFFTRADCYYYNFFFAALTTFFKSDDILNFAPARERERRKKNESCELSLHRVIGSMVRLLALHTAFLPENERLNEMSDLSITTSRHLHSSCIGPWLNCDMTMCCCSASVWLGRTRFRLPAIRFKSGHLQTTRSEKLCEEAISLSSSCDMCRCHPPGTNE